MAVIDHVHTYGKWKKQGNPPEQWYRCLDPACTHIAPRSLIVGKYSLCSVCKETQVILDWKQLDRRKQCVCLNCQQTNEGKLYRENKKKAQEILNEIHLEEKIL